MHIFVTLFSVCVFTCTCNFDIRSYDRSVQYIYLLIYLLTCRCPYTADVTCHDTDGQHVLIIQDHDVCRVKRLSSVNYQVSYAFKQIHTPFSCTPVPPGYSNWYSSNWIIFDDLGVVANDINSPDAVRLGGAYDGVRASPVG